MKQATKAFKAFAASTETLGDKRQVKVAVSTEQPDRQGDIVVQDGIDLSNFKNTRTVLWNHDQDHPIASCVDIGVVGKKLQATVQFPDEGVSEKADEIYGLIKSGIVNSASIGFLPLDGEPADGKNPRNGVRIDKSELLEFSFVSVPANPGAVIQARSMRSAPAKVKTMKIKGLYDVANFAYLLAQLGYMAQSAAEERDWEGDESTVPERIADLCRAGGEVFLAMSEEEMAEMLATLPGTEKSGDVQAKMMIGLAKAMGKTVPEPKEKAGRKFSAASVKAMSAACDKMMEGHKSIQEAHDMVKSMADDADCDPDDPDCDDDDTEKSMKLKNAREKRQRQTRLLELS